MQASNFLQEAQLFRKSYEKAVGAVAVRHGMPVVELHVLLFLANNPEYDTARDVVELRFLAKSCVSKAVDALTERGFLEAEVDRGDRRVLHLRIQEAAADVLKQAQDAQEAFFSRLYREIPEKELAALGGTLAKMADNIREEHGK